MVLLTVTPAAKTAILLYNDLKLAHPEEGHLTQQQHDPLPLDVKVGDPISHSQLIHLSTVLKKAQPLNGSNEHGLDSLLKGSKIYLSPPKPKPEPVSCIMSIISTADILIQFHQTSEYKALMARLRAQEEDRAYERIINPPPPLETFSQRFPSAAPAIPVVDDLDEVVYADVNRQLALIINVLVSIIACSIAIWIAARHWSLPQRMALSMFGSGLVATAEIVIFSGYIRRVKDARQEELAKVETKEIMDTWVIDKRKDASSSAKADTHLRQRKPGKGKHR